MNQTGKFLTYTALASGTLGFYTLGIEPYLLTIEQPTLYCPRLPHGWEGIKILFLADTHISQWGRREHLLIDLLQKIPLPDLVFWGGDMIQGTSGIVPAAEVCRAVRQIFPVPTYAVLGNAEHKTKKDDRRDFVRRLRNAGIVVLINRNEPLRFRDETITIAGCDDPYYGHADMDATLAAMPPDRFRLLLAHSPQVAVIAARHDVDLMLSGHTHGGQIRLPFLGALRTQNPLSNKMDCGIFDRARMTAVLGGDPGGDTITYITRGVGVASVWKIPLYPRFLCRPEVTVLTLRRAE